MFWIGLTIALISTLLGVNLFRKILLKYFPKINDTRIDIILTICILIGLGVATIQYLLDQSEISSLKNEVEYQEVAGYNALGNKSAQVMGIHMVHTPINDWSVSFIFRSEGKIIFRCDSLAIEACKVVIKKLPSYPFAYYFLALCQKEIGDNSWKQNAQIAKSIFEETTSIPNHHPDHDEILSEAIKMLKD